MTRLIDADALYKLFLEMHKQGNTCDPQDVLKAITNAPTIEADSGEALIKSLNERLANFDELNKPKPLNLDIKYDI